MASIFEELQLLILNLNNEYDKIKSQRPNGVNYENDKLKFDKLNDGINEIKELEKKLRNPKKKIVILGRISNGKSTLVNCLLGQEILSSGCGVTTKNITRIQLTGQDNTNLYKIDELAEDKEDKVENDANDEGNIISSKSVFLKNAVDIVSHDVQLFDTPGLDDDKNLDVNVSKLCGDSFLQVLMLDVKSAIGRTEIKSIKKIATQFTNFNLSVIFNFWDLYCDRTGSDELKKEQLDRTIKILVDELAIDPSEAEKKIYFLSTEKILECIDNNPEMEMKI